MAKPGLSMSSSFPVALPSDLTVHTFNYSHKCFPRWNRLVRYLKFPIPLEHKVDVVCSADHAVNKSDFALETDDEGKESFAELKPSTVFVCILQCDKNGSLTEQDRHLLDYFKSHMVFAHQEKIFFSRFVEDNNKEALFVIVGKLTDMELCRVSEEINEQMGFVKKHNYVLHRMFLNKSDEIDIRISLLLEERIIKWVEFYHRGSQREDIEKFKTQNKVDLQYHQFKIVSLRNKNICEFGYANENLFVSLKDLSKRDEVSDYLQTFIQNPQNIEIRQFEKMEVEDLSVQSGEKVANANQTFGTVGLSLIDGAEQYCATCRHVVEACLGTSNIVSPRHDSNLIIIDTQIGRFETNQIFTPSLYIDFSAVRLLRTDIQISSSLRNRLGNSVNGELFNRDNIVLPTNTEIYKWGVTTNLTTGTLQGVTDRGDYSYGITVDSTSCFAEKGDSGSLICYSDEGSEIAVFILTERMVDKKKPEYSGERRQQFNVYKLADMMRLCKSKLPGLKACISTDD